MQITVMTKVQGMTEFSSEGIGVTLDTDDIGVPEPKTSEETKEAFVKMCELANFMIATEMYKGGHISKKVSIARRRRWLKRVKGS